MFRPLLASACAAGFLFASPASASVGMACSIADKTLNLSLEGTISRGVGEGLIAVAGTVNARVGFLSSGLSTFSFERDDITQYWLGRHDLKLRLYRESAGEPHETIDIVIDVSSKKDPDGVSYTGTYVLSASSMAGVTTGEAKTSERKGRASCTVE